jgi:DNA polymerase-3 subunit alpha
MLDIDAINFKNEKTWKLIQSGNTGGVFQLESELGKQWASKIKPKNINELSAVLALIRPACLESGMTEMYSRVKNGKEPPNKFGDDDVDRILNPTMGVLIYQEQLMKFGGEIAWRDFPYIDRLVIVDKLRKGIGKKDYKVINDLREKFVNGCIKNGKGKDLAEKLFSMIESAGRYAFNDAHAKKYAVWSYRTAYLKANFPYEFYCTYLTYSKARQKPREELHDMINEAKMNGISIIPPSIIESSKDFKILNKDGKSSIIYGLCHIKQFGEKDWSIINNERPSTFSQFIKLSFRENDSIRSLGVESLIKSGACDCYGLSRKCMLDVVSAMNQLTVRETKYIIENISDGNSVDIIKKAMLDCAVMVSTKPRKQIVKSEAEAIDVKSTDTSDWKALNEQELLGISMTCSAVDSYKDITEFTCKDCYRMLRNNRGVAKRVIASVVDVEFTVTKKGENPGQEMCQLNIADATGSIRMVMFPSAYAKYKNKIRKDGKYELTIKGTGSGWCVESLIEIN